MERTLNVMLAVGVLLAVLGVQFRFARMQQQINTLRRQLGIGTADVGVEHVKVIYNDRPTATWPLTPEAVQYLQARYGDSVPVRPSTFDEEDGT